jgi:tight adherence protein C
MSAASTVLATGVFLAMGGLAASWWSWSQGEGTAQAEVRRSVVARSRVPVFAKVLATLARPTDAADRVELRVELMQAGWQSPDAPAWFSAGRVLCALVVPAVLLGADPTSSTIGMVGWVAMTATLGYFIPPVLLWWLRGRRQARISRAVPDMLDMLVSCLEAGLGVDAAMRRVSRDIGVVAPELAAEMQQADAEMVAGMSRTAALERLDMRTGVEELRALVVMLSQAERYGAGVAPSIKAHAQLVRSRRSLAAEKVAARASPVLTIVMIVLILPALFVVLLGPTVVHLAFKFGWAS